MNKTKEPTIKADDFVEYESMEKPEKFTNFQELLKRVEILKENFDEVVEILRQNNIKRKQIIEAPYFDDDELYRRLENDE